MSSRRSLSRNRQPAGSASASAPRSSARTAAPAESATALEEVEQFDVDMKVRDGACHLLLADNSKNGENIWFHFELSRLVSCELNYVKMHFEICLAGSPAPFRLDLARQKNAGEFYSYWSLLELKDRIWAAKQKLIQ